MVILAPALSYKATTDTDNPLRRMSPASVSDMQAADCACGFINPIPKDYLNSFMTF